MKFKPKYILILLIILISVFSFSKRPLKQQQPKQISKDSIKKIAVADSLKLITNLKLKLFKENAHASYYAEKFTGRKTASGRRFDNNKYTAAHRKLPFGTKVKVTNQANKKFVIVEITDRGPFTKGRDIDLSKRAFMDIASSKYGGSLKVKIEEVLK
jgi:rare lipoprotein A